MGPEWKGNEDVFEALLADNASPFELGVQTLRSWLEVAETEYARGDREALRDALAVMNGPAKNWRLFFHFRACRSI